jgi:hypothetical protein
MKRRTLLAGVGALAVAAAAGGAAWKLRLFRKRYPPGPYDDVLGKLDDREWAAKFGETAQAALPRFTPTDAAATLRQRLAHDSLQTAALREAEADRLVEADGWLTPESIALIAALAKSAN